MRLFATDLDGTLLDKSGRIHPRDRDAIARAHDRGVIVTIATGRLAGGTRSIAAELGLSAPVVCADGGVTLCSAAERVLERRAIPMSEARGIVERLRERRLSQFLFDHEGILSCEQGRAHHDYVRGWSPMIRAHEDVLHDDHGWHAQPPLMLVGIGGQESVDALASEVLAACPDLEALSFTVSWTGERVVRFIRRGVSKASGLAALAESLGIARERVAVIGDFYNDVPMFEWAPRSFAMPHAPADVKSAASDSLEDGSWERGAIADALDLWLADET